MSLKPPRVIGALAPLRPGNSVSDTVVIDVNAHAVYVVLAQGDSTPTTPTSFLLTGGPQTPVPTAVAIGDVTGDGKPDLVITDAANNAVLVLPGNGDGTFGTLSSISLGGSNVPPAAVAVADLNGDGKADIVIGNVGSVSVLLNNGTGGFGAPTTYPAPVTADCSTGCDATVTLGDLNGDAKPDIVTTTTLAANTNQITVLLNHGDGTFATATPYMVGAGPMAIALGDLNMDGKPDLAVANYRDGTVSVLLNTGNGAFGPHADYAVGAQPMAVTLSDQNLDGILDLVAVGGDGSFTILSGKGDGTFPHVTYPTGNQPQDVITPVLTASGRHDLVISSGTDRTITILLNDGQGGFTPASGSPIALPCTPTGLAAADFNGDGKTDIAVACSDGVRILTGNSMGGFTIGVPLPAYGSYLVAADLGNGHPDLVVNGGSVYILLNDGTGSFTAASGSPLALGAATNADSLAVADINGDGKPDLLVGVAPTGMHGGQVAVLLGRGDGTFAAASASPIAAGTAPPSVKVGDVNGDGKPDLVLLSGTSSTLFNDTTGVLLGHGDGTFGAPAALPNPLGSMYSNYYGGVTVTDLDGDGTPDIAVVDRCGSVGCVVLFRGNGDGTFAVAGIYDFGQGATYTDPHSSALRAADLSGRGFPDLVTQGIVNTGGFTTTGIASVMRNGWVSPSAATHLVVSSMPAAVPVGSRIAVSVAAADTSGRLVTGFGGSITLSLTGGSGLTGSLVQTADIGSTLFLGLSITNPGTNLTITATSGSLTGASTTFNVTGIAPTPLSQPTPHPTGVPQAMPPLALPTRHPDGAAVSAPTPLPQPSRR